MSAAIVAEDLTRQFGATTALRGVSFSVGQEEVVGFLGPNGAGKTTTLRILSGFLAASSGRAVVGGVDVTANPVALRQQIGYLPERVAFYDEMRVHEYLDYRARVKQLGNRQRRRARQAAVIAECGLDDVRKRLVGQLSKGYRQRVGLADSLLADPAILILDEPTVGLDPQSIRQVRKLIIELGQRRTVLLSSHILPEVEAICPRVIIINQGKIVAEGTPDGLTQLLPGANRVMAEVQGATTAEVSQTFGALPGVEEIQVKPIEDGAVQRAYLLGAGQADTLREDVFDCATSSGWQLRELRRDTPNLEEIFLQVTAGGLPRMESAPLPPPTQPPPKARHSILASLATQLKRELGAYFLTPLAWIVMTVFLFVTGTSFFGYLLASYYNLPGLTQFFFGNIFFWFLMLFMPPILTMRSFSEENRTERIQMLSTTPGSELSLLTAKYLAAVCMFSTLWLLTVSFFLTLDQMAMSKSIPHPVDWGPVATSYIGTLATGAMFLAVGMLTSILARDQLVAAVLAMIVAVSMFGIGYLLPHAVWDPAQREALTIYSLMHQHYRYYARGLIDSRHVVATVSTTLILLAISLRLLETRRWR